MRLLQLKDTDADLFNQDITPSENHFLSKHMDAFKRMWHEQGKEFWARFTVNFISCAAQHGVMKDFPESCDTSQEILEGIFCLIQDQYIFGKYSQAKALILDIVVVAKNVHLLPHMESNSMAKDPFFVKETRDSFRNLFGTPDQKTSYMNVYILLPMFSRFGGSMCVCLRRWLGAPPIDPDFVSYWTAPVDGSVDRYRNLTTPEFMKYLEERLRGQPKEPCFVENWIFGDPRFSDTDNPLYDPSADKTGDWREELRPSQYIEFLKYVDELYNPARQENGDKDVTAIVKKKILEERLWENDATMQVLRDEFDQCCTADQDEEGEEEGEEEMKYNIVWNSEREYAPDISHCDCSYLKNDDHLENAFVGRIRTDSERSMVIFYTMCWHHNDNMRIEIPVNLAKYRAYPEQPLCEVEMEMSETAKTDIIKYVTNIVVNNKETPKITLDPVPITELPLYITVAVKWCSGVHGLRIDHDIREMRKRALALKLGYGGLRTAEDISALAKAVVESTQSFIATLPYSDAIAESGLHQDSRDSEARQRLRRKMKQKKKHEETLKAKRAESDATALLELFKFEIKNCFPNSIKPKKALKEKKASYPKEAQVREQMRKDFQNLRDCVTDVSFLKSQEEWLSEERTFADCLEKAMKETGVQVTTELGFPFGRSSYYKLLHRNAARSCVRVYFNTSSGPRYVPVRLSASTRCDNGAEKNGAPHVNMCDKPDCPCHYKQREAMLYLEQLLGRGDNTCPEKDPLKDSNSTEPPPMMFSDKPRHRTPTTFSEEPRMKPPPTFDDKPRTKPKTKSASSAASWNAKPKASKLGPVPTSVCDNLVKSIKSATKEHNKAKTKKKSSKENKSADTKPTSTTKSSGASREKSPDETKYEKSPGEKEYEGGITKVVYEDGVKLTFLEPLRAPNYSVHTESSSSPTHSINSSGSNNNNNVSSVSSGKSKKLRKCHYCQNTEPLPKTYKKCNKCKTEGIKNARFYCGKECQTEDWKIRHKEEHKNNMLQKQ